MEPRAQNQRSDGNLFGPKAVHTHQISISIKIQKDLFINSFSIFLHLLNKYVTNEVLNRELPKNMRISYFHYDMKKRKKEVVFPFSLHQLVKPYIKKTGYFVCDRQKMSESMSHIEVQRGVIRTNCIDSLDRTNEAQCFIGMYVLKKQLKKLGLILKSSEVRADQPLGIQFKNLFDEHGDLISLQYGGSKAHHSNLTKKKKFLKNVIPELITSVKRHYANNFLDPQRQLIINLFLGLYKPVDHEGQNHHWNVQYDWKLQQKLNETLKLPEITGKDRWWEDSLRKFEPTLPLELRKDLEYFFAMSKKGDGDKRNQQMSNITRKESNDESSALQNIGESGKYPFSQSSSSNLLRQNTNQAQADEEDDFFQLRDELEKGADQPLPTRHEEGSILDKFANQRQKVRFAPVAPTAKPSPYDNRHSLLRFPSAQIQRQASHITGFFENSSYNNQGGPIEIEDDDPFYEIYDCHKVTFIESKLNDPLSHFEPCEFAREDIKDYIKAQFDFKQGDNQSDNFYNSVKNRVFRVMDPIIQNTQLVDAEEIATFKSYLELPNQIPKLSTLDYHCYLERHPDKIVKQSKWTDFTEKLCTDEDVKKVRTKQEAMKEFKHDLDMFDAFGNYDYTQLDSYKVERIVLSSTDQYHKELGYMQLDENTKEYEKERPQGLSMIQTGDKSYLEYIKFQNQLIKNMFFSSLKFRLTKITPQMILKDKSSLRKITMLKIKKGFRRSIRLTFQALQNSSLMPLKRKKELHLVSQTTTRRVSHRHSNQSNEVQT